MYGGSSKNYFVEQNCFWRDLAIFRKAKNGGEGEIRTREAVAHLRAFQARALDRAVRPLHFAIVLDSGKMILSHEMAKDLFLII